jgi:hypothetical protein
VRAADFGRNIPHTGSDFICKRKLQSLQHQEDKIIQNSSRPFYQPFEDGIVIDFMYPSFSSYLYSALIHIDLSYLSIGGRILQILLICQP